MYTTASQRISSQQRNRSSSTVESHGAHTGTIGTDANKLFFRRTNPARGRTNLTTAVTSNKAATLQSDTSWPSFSKSATQRTYAEVAALPPGGSVSRPGSEKSDSTSRSPSTSPETPSGLDPTPKQSKRERSPSPLRVPGESVDHYNLHTNKITLIEELRAIPLPLELDSENW